jgi:cobaltochelatase CobN
MLEAARKDYWKADAATVDELKREYLALAKQHDVTTDNAALSEFIGLGQQALPSAPAKPSSASRSNTKTDANDRAKPPSPSVKVASPQAVPVVKGIQLQKLSTLPNTTPSNPWHQSGLWGLIAMLLAFMSGVFLQLRLKKSA